MNKLFKVVLVLVSAAVTFYTASNISKENNFKKVNNDYFEKCTFVYKTNSGLEIMKNNLKPDVYVNNSTTPYFVVTNITHCYGAPVIKNIKEIKPKDTLIMSEKEGVLMNGVGKDSYWFSYSLLRQETVGVMIPDSAQGVWFYDESKNLRDYIYYENYNKQKEEDSSALSGFLLAISLSALVVMFVLGVLAFFQGKKVWVGDDKYKGYILRKTRITRKYILLYSKDYFIYYRISDKDKDGVADFKERIVGMGKFQSTSEQEINSEDKVAYAYALRQAEKQI